MCKMSQKPSLGAVVRNPPEAFTRGRPNSLRRPQSGRNAGNPSGGLTRGNFGNPSEGLTRGNRGNPAGSLTRGNPRNPPGGLTRGLPRISQEAAFKALPEIPQKASLAGILEAPQEASLTGILEIVGSHERDYMNRTARTGTELLGSYHVACRSEIDRRSGLQCKPKPGWTGWPRTESP